MHGELALAVVLASHGTAAIRGEAAPAFDDPDGVARRIAPDLDARGWALGLAVDRIWLERDWSLLAGRARWHVRGGHLTTLDAGGAAPWSPDLAAAERALRTAIEASAANAARDGHDHWAGFFADALTVDTGDTLLLAPSAPLAARKLSALVGAAWAFGGMGSWNDVADDDAGLYDALVVAQVAAANAD